MFNRLRILRAERRASQLYVALSASIHPTRLWKLENGYAEPTVAERAAIARVLEVSEEEIWPSEPSRSRDSVGRLNPAEGTGRA